MKDTSYCAGCDDDFYNGGNPYDIKECWSLKSAKVVTRYKCHWWTPTLQINFTKVKTYSCHRESGKNAFYTPEAFRNCPIA
jgi:hypothetical protein